MSKRMLLLSASRYGESPYLAHALSWIDAELTPIKAKRPRMLFIPYAAVLTSYDEYMLKVQESLCELDIEIEGIHLFERPDLELEKADAVLVGGGNTFRLLERLYALQMIEPLKALVQEGLIYIGWSAGTNIVCPTIATTNDMPIIQPPSLKSLGLIPFQINPHYTEAHHVGYHGKSRLQRLAEYLALLPGQKVLAVPEGSALQIFNESAQLFGEPKSYWISVAGKEEVKPYHPFKL